MLLFHSVCVRCLCGNSNLCHQSGSFGRVGRVPGMAIAFPALVVVSAATSTLIEMPHAAHPIVSVFFNFAFLPNDVNADSVSSFTVFNLIPDRDGASCALFDSFDCWTTPSSTKLCQITLIAYSASLFVSRVIASVP